MKQVCVANRTSALCTIMIGGLITLYGYFAPWMVSGSCLATIGSGLIYTFDAQSTSGTWIGYQILAGLGFGLAFQTPIMAAQALAAQEDVPTTTAILYCKFAIHVLDPTSTS